MDSCQALISKIKSEHESGRLVLPSLPEIVVCVRQAVNNDDVNLGDVVKLIQRDPFNRTLSSNRKLPALSMLTTGRKLFNGREPIGFKNMIL